MYPFHWSEILLYLVPVITLVLVNQFGRKFLNNDGKIELAVVDVMHPIIWVSIHLVSLYAFYYSFIPIFGTLFCGLAIVLLGIQFREGKPFKAYNFFRRLSNLTFIFTFIGFYILVITRIIKLTL